MTSLPSLLSGLNQSSPRDLHFLHTYLFYFASLCHMTLLTVLGCSLETFPTHFILVIIAKAELGHIINNPEVPLMQTLT